MNVAERLRCHITSGLHLQTLHKGDRLPSIRELAKSWGVDPRAVRDGYQRLESDGFVRLRPRSGVYVAAVGPDISHPLPQSEEWIVEALLSARERGISPIDAVERLRDRISARSLRTACIECNGDQRAWLVHETARDYGLDSYPVELDDVMSDAKADAVSGAELIVGTAFHAAQLRRLAARTDRRLVLIRLDPAFVSEVVARLSAGPVYFVVADHRFAEKLPAVYAHADGARNLRPIVAQRGVRPQVPDGAHVLVTRAAQQQLGPAIIHSTIPRSERVFCPLSSAALLRAIVSVNTALARSTL